jgi:hypothetical protein
MSNMSYCRFENTLEDMEDCLRALEQAGGRANYLSEHCPSSNEEQAINAMAETARALVDELIGE